MCLPGTMGGCCGLGGCFGGLPMSGMMGMQSVNQSYSKWTPSPSRAYYYRTLSIKTPPPNEAALNSSSSTMPIGPNSFTSTNPVEKKYFELASLVPGLPGAMLQRVELRQPQRHAEAKLPRQPSPALAACRCQAWSGHAEREPVLLKWTPSPSQVLLSHVVHQDAAPQRSGLEFILVHHADRPKFFYFYDPVEKNAHVRVR